MDMIVKNKYTGESIFLLAPVPTTIDWTIKKAIMALLWHLRDPTIRKPYDKFYYGIIKHTHEFDHLIQCWNAQSTGFYSPCKHYGCNLVRYTNYERS